MNSSDISIHHEFKNVDKIDFTLEWNALQKAKAQDQNPPECPNCKFVSPETKCVFCGHQTTAGVFTDKIAIYKIQKETDEKKEARTRVYCIDISGSMQGPRINYIKEEIKNELNSFVRSNREDKVCIITFESDCHIIGDGFSEEVTVGCECSFDKINEIALKYKNLRPISESIDKLRDKVAKIECVGRTASISALSLATSIAALTGGEVLFYTDGMRNKGLPAAGYTDKIIEKATKCEPGKEVTISIFFFANCQAFIAEYSECADKTKGQIHPIHIGKEKKSGEAQVVRERVAYDVKVTTKASDEITFENGENAEITFKHVCNHENMNLRYNVPKNTPAKQKVGQSIYAQVKVEYKDKNGAIYNAYIYGSIKIVNTIAEKDVQQEVSTKLNMIALLIEKENWKDAKAILEELLSMDFRIGHDANNFFKNAFNELLSYLEHAQTDSNTKKDDIVALLNYMKTARKDGIKV